MVLFWYLLLAVWACNNQVDCQDSGCLSWQSTCENRKGIPRDWLCDNEDDCGDGSDERDCRCEREEFTCENMRCIPDGWRCDNEDDCGDASDERGCQMIVPCTVNQFRCSIHQCILSSYLCDGDKHCANGRDELDCSPRNCTEQEFRCDNGRCVFHQYKCDNDNDCGDNSDEQCTLPARVLYWSFNAVGKTWLMKVRGDPDEWAEILALSNGTLRKVPSFSAKLEYNTDFWALGSDYQTQRLFWFDGGHHHVGRVFMLPMATTTRQILAARSSTENNPIAVDWVSKNVYWADRDTNASFIAMVSYRNARSRIVVDSRHVTSPVALAVAPRHRYLFWAEGGTSRAIKRSGLDGLNIVTIVMTAQKPVLLTIDQSNQRLFWLDEGSKSLVSSLFDGSNVETVWTSAAMSPGTYAAMAIYKNFVFLAKRDRPESVILDRRTGNKYAEHNIILKEDSYTDVTSHGLSMMAPENQPATASACDINNGLCDGICIHDTSTESTCACEFGFTLQPDGRTCSAAPVEDNFLLVADNDARGLYQIEVATGDVHKIPLTSPGQPIAVAYDGKEKNLYWADVSTGRIRRASLDGRVEEEYLILEPGSIPRGLAIDVETNRIYFTDSGNKRITYHNGTISTQLLSLSSEREPRDIVLDVYERTMYWTDWGSSARIERASMDDGSGRTALISSGLVWPNGLAIDFEERLMYWCDGDTNTVERANLDGTNRRLLVREPEAANHLVALTVGPSFLYVTNLYKRYVTRIHKTTLVSDKVGPAFFSRLDGIHFHLNLRTTEQSTSPTPSPLSSASTASSDPDFPGGTSTISESEPTVPPGSLDTTTIIIIAVVVGGVVLIVLTVTIGVMVVKSRRARANGTQPAEFSISNPGYEREKTVKDIDDIYLTPMRESNVYLDIREIDTAGGSPLSTFTGSQNA